MFTAGSKKSGSVWGDPGTTPAFDPREVRDEPEPSSKLGYVFAFLVVLLVAFGVLWYFYLQKRVVAPAVSIDYVARTSSTYSGVPFTAAIAVSNTSNEPLTNAHFSLLLPDGVYFADQSPDQRLVDRPIGDVGPGSVTQEEYSLVAGAPAQTVQHLQATLDYSSQKFPGQQFEKKADLAVTIDQPAAGFSLQAPESVYGGQPAEVKISYTNNAPQSFTGLKIHLETPDAFTVASTTLPPAAAGNATGSEWLVDLPQNGSGTLSVFGAFVGPENSVYPVAANISVPYGGRYVVVASLTTPVSLRAAPLSLSLMVNNASDYVAHASDTLDYRLTYKNNADIPMENVVVQATVANSLFDYTTVDTQGSFDSVNNVITWRASQVPALQSVGPGQAGAVEFRVRLKSAFSVARMTDKNYTVAVAGTVSSPTVPENTAASGTKSEVRLTTKVAGSLSFQEKGLWKDAQSKVLNQGPYPPRVNVSTQYTVHWIVASVASDMANIHVSAFLQNGTRWTGTVKGNTPTLPQYNAQTGEVTWDVPSMPANTGVLTAPDEALFQIENTPAVNQTGQVYQLVGKATLTAHDQYGNVDVTQTADPLLTSLPDDQAAAQGSRGVMP